MKSRLYIGHIKHARLTPVTHRFVLPAYYLALDLAELPELGPRLTLLGYNRLRPAALYDRDYLGGGDGTIAAKLTRILQAHHCADRLHRVILVTCPRHFGFGFNPISLFFAYQLDGALGCVVAEVRNTYGEAHIYVLRDALAPRRGFQVRYRTPKTFFVSPFNDMKGDYEFRMSLVDEQLHVRIDLLRDGQPALMTELQGMGMSLNRRNLARTLVRFPGNAALAAPRIAWQALQLRRHGLRPRMKPKPVSPMTRQMGRPMWLGLLYRSVWGG
ncbi:MAG: hypothetical protein ETSY1_25065 [Candidatus Entotheonella factor]|uniref:DUF1365 domain-containing protein n=1 Tax=Entotheonella factor TaxID=1429438 RepID=W4LG16_ENTF1|nr:DUF1365 domain-containing protein [Candidatus Entotheonella palauensis]ETW96819.1 MAG: hypothetical protein ETSY1_25065 [Candidatus Entotheonella factor]